MGGRLSWGLSFSKMLAVMEILLMEDLEKLILILLCFIL